MDNCKLVNKIKKKTSIVILAYHEPKKFEKMFRVLINNTHQEVTPYEIIVVDNHADKEIKQFIHAQPEISTIISFPENAGVSKGYNIGAQNAHGHYLAFLNSDYYMMDGWLESMIDCFEHQPKIGIISTCTNHTANPNEKVDCIFDGETSVVELPMDYKESEYAIACMFTTQKILNEVNWFDEFYFVHWEDLDINEAIKKAGYKVFVNRKCFGYHDFDLEKLKDRIVEDTKGREYFQNKWCKLGW